MLFSVAGVMSGTAVQRWQVLGLPMTCAAHAPLDGGTCACVMINKAQKQFVWECILTYLFSCLLVHLRRMRWL